MPKLEQDAIDSALQGLTGWSQEGQSIRRQYEFADFTGAIDFVNRVAPLANAADHHPDIDIRYNKVLLSLSTHSEGGLTEKDFQLAAQIDARP